MIPIQFIGVVNDTVGGFLMQSSTSAVIDLVRHNDTFHCFPNAVTKGVEGFRYIKTRDAPFASTRILRGYPLQQTPVGYTDNSCVDGMMSVIVTVLP